MPKPSKKYNCNILPNRIQTFSNIKEVRQKMGWQITAFNLPEPWKYTMGEGVKVAIVDSGCDLNHSDLKDNLLPGRNFIDPSKPPFDNYKHGTHLTGILCAENNDIGMIGVAPKSKVIPVKALDEKGKGDMRIVADAIRWSADQGVDFIVLSLGSPRPLDVILKAVQYAVAQNAVVICAAGNAGKNKKIFFPAAYPETIAIGAIDKNFNFAEFSCTGSEMDFLAPGVEIMSTIPDNWYGLMTGTSMAAPFFCGVCALLLSYVRNNNLKISLKNKDDYCKILKNYTLNAKNVRTTERKLFEGFGIIDPNKLEKFIENFASSQ